MKKIIYFILLISISSLLCACGLFSGASDAGAEVGNKESSIGTICRSPYDSNKYKGMNYMEVESVLTEAGFSQIVFEQIDDIDSKSDIADGAVESVIISDLSEYSSEREFNADIRIIIAYHNIPKVKIPFSAEDAKSKHYMEVGKAFYDAGFVNVFTDEVYDLASEDSSETVISVNDSQLGEETEYPFDSEVSVIEHFPVSKYKTYIIIDFDKNLIFNKYGVDITLNGENIGSLEHGEDGRFEVMLSSGKYEMVFTSAKESDVTGSTTFVVDSQTNVNCKISCWNDNVKIESLKYYNVLNSNSVMLPYSCWHYYRKDSQTVVDELIALGFSNVTSVETTDQFWGSDRGDSVVGIRIAGKEDFSHDDIFSKSVEIEIYYHVADFEFSDLLIQIIEKENFELAYTLNSGESIDDISFEIDNSDVLQRNEDGSYTALKPGTATVTAFSGEHKCSQCKVEVVEIVVPIEKLEFSSDSMEVSVGSKFIVEYSIVPENANYTDIRVEMSNELLEENKDHSFYSKEAGETTITFYQDDRNLGSCKVKATYYEIEEVVFAEEITEIFVGDTMDLKFSLTPENATNKGITVSSSDEEVASVLFDEREDSAVKIKGLRAGETTITILTLEEKEYSCNITVKNVEPTDIILKNAEPDKRIEVGDSIKIETSWKPLNTTIKEVKWSSSDNKIITVEDDGSFTAVGVGSTELIAEHESGVTSNITIVVEPTLVTGIEITTDQNYEEKFYPGNKFTITAFVLPENATDKALVYTSSDENIAKVSDKGVVTAVGAGTATIKVESPNGIKKTVSVTVSPAPQKFKITWSAYLSSNDHVGNNWEKAFYINDELFKSGNTIVLDSESYIYIFFRVSDYDENPDTGTYEDYIDYSEDLVKNGYSTTTYVAVEENAGRYSGHFANWELTIKITPIK